MPTVTLTVQSTGHNSYRLGINLQDSNEYFHIRGRNVSLIIDDLMIDTRTTCGPPLNKGFDLYDREISQWIIEKGFNLYPYRRPTKLLFEITEENDTLTLSFIEYIINV